MFDIAQNIEQALPTLRWRVPDAAGIKVEAPNGTVMLSVFARNVTEKSTAATIARGVSGVKAVHNAIAARTRSIRRTDAIRAAGITLIVAGVPGLFNGRFSDTNDTLQASLGPIEL